MKVIEGGLEELLKSNTLYHGDCLELMQDIDDKSVGLILCDLPYGVTNRNKWDEVIPFEPLWEHYERIIKDNAAIVLTATQPFATSLISSNRDLFRYDLIWEKSTPTGFLNANRMPLRNHELVLVFYKHLPTYNPQFWYSTPYKTKATSESSNWGKYKTTETDASDGRRYPLSVIEIAGERQNKLHPTQKPVELFKYLIRTYTNEGDLVLDNCMGSGTTAIACIDTNRNWIGMELEEEYIQKANERIRRHLDEISKQE